MAAAITSAVLAVGASGYQIYNAEQQKADAKKQIEEFESQDLVNPYENIRVSTLASDQATQANLSNFATGVDALQRGGARTVLAGLPRMNEGNIALQNQISQDLERQDIQREMMIAQGQDNIQRVREGREQLALQGLGQAYQTARQDSASGIFNLASGALAFGSALNNQYQPPTDPIAQRQAEINRVNKVMNQGATIGAGASGFQPAATVSQNIFQNPNIPFGYDNASMYQNNPFIFNS